MSAPRSSVLSVAAILAGLAMQACSAGPADGRHAHGLCKSLLLNIRARR